MPKKPDAEPEKIDAEFLEQWDSEEALTVEPEQQAPPERVFALRVIQMALFDFCSDDALNRKEAEQWLLNGGHVFEMWCDLAGLEPNSLTSLCRSYHKNPEFLRMLRQRVFRVIL